MSEQTTASARDGSGGRRPGRTQTVDFTRPTKFTPDHERRLQRAFAAFCRTSATRLSAELRMPVELDLGETAQLTWANAHDQLSPTALCGVIEPRPHETQMLLAADAGFVLTAIESLLGGPCEQAPPERRLTEIDLALAERLFEGLLAQLEVIWRDLAGSDLALATLDTLMETAQVAPVSEPTLALRIEARMRGEDYRLTLLVPHRAIAPVEDRILGRHAGGEESGDPADRERLRTALAETEVTLRAEIPGPRMAAARMLALAPGESFDLEARVGGGLSLSVDGVGVLRGAPGRSGGRRAVQVTAEIEPGLAETLPRLAAGAGHAAGPPNRDLSRSLGDVPVRTWVDLGRAELSLAEVAGLRAGAVVELDRRVDDPVQLYVNGLRFASGELLIGAEGEWAIGVESVGEPA